MFKKMILFTVVLLSSMLSCFPDKPLDSHTLPAYADLYINSLFGTRHEQSVKIREFIHDVKHEAERSAKENCSEFIWFIPTGKFKRDCVEHAIRTTVVETIAEEVHAIAYTFTHDPATLSYISQTIYHEVLMIFTESKNLNGSLNGYIGERLKEKVLQLKNKFDQEKRLKESVSYPSAACCSCLESFDNDIRQIFLRPCGHDICADCARNWFYQQNKTSCPHCRSDVSKSELRKALQGK